MSKARKVTAIAKNGEKSTKFTFILRKKFILGS